MKEIVHEMISEEKVEARIRQMAEQLNQDYAGKTLHMIGILRGSVIFYSQLAKSITVPVTMDFMTTSSYGESTISSGLEVRKDLDEDIDGRHVLIVEDIIDSGNTLSMVRRMLEARNPASLRICTLLDKPDRRETPVEVEYTGFEIPDKFVVGYGLDYAQRYRNLPYLGEIEIVEE